MLTYKDAGVDIEAGNRLVDRLKSICPGIGGFSGIYPFGSQYLVACTDGVGTKLKLAIDWKDNSQIGQDLVAMCINDLITTGAKPLFFLDYFATSKLDVHQAEEVISSIVRACKEVDCALLGGETAEMPGMYQEGDYDLCGFAVGAVDKEQLIDGSTISPGDCFVGLPSSGVHSNGYSLIRKVLEQTSIDQIKKQELLCPTRLYVHEVARCTHEFTVKGIAHITGGGLEENTRRLLPKNCDLEIDWSSWTPPSLFSWIQKEGSVPEEDMRRTFNMGIGLVFVVPEEQASFLAMQEEGVVLGTVTQKGASV